MGVIFGIPREKELPVRLRLAFIDHQIINPELECYRAGENYLIIYTPQAPQDIFFIQIEG